ncbi:hypothetical protein M514_14102 [Trichuris suis]|uniref:Uncharacterized protein n=2 Tax=Trichuris suis TaxID=68888 RepID=A0A085NBI3_9BILA|nr:hypothetical protein M514_14102 [Trichuris suis]
MEMNRWEHITGKGSVVDMAHTKKMHSGTCEKESDQRRQTHGNIRPHTNGNVHPVETYDGQRKPVEKRKGRWRKRGSMKAKALRKGCHGHMASW